MAEMPGSHRDQWGSQSDVVLLDKDNGGAYTWVTSNPFQIRAVLHGELSGCQLDQSPSPEHIGSIDEVQINFAGGPLCASDIRPQLPRVSGRDAFLQMRKPSQLPAPDGLLRSKLGETIGERIRSLYRPRALTLAVDGYPKCHVTRSTSTARAVCAKGIQHDNCR
jgi:hypothetical protein